MIYGYDPIGERGKPVATVRELNDIPKCEAGAPLPAIVCDEHHTSLFYFAEKFDQNWDGSTIRMLTPQSSGEVCVVVRFKFPLAHFFGPPNDEAIDGHPYAKIGLRSYGIFEIINSDWIEGLRSRNRVHPNHSDVMFEGLRHLIFTFHDTTFEIVSDGYQFDVLSGVSIDQARRIELERQADL